MVVVDLRQPGRTLDLVLRVNVERLDQSLLPELAPELHRSVQFSKFDPRDLHQVFLIYIRAEIWIIIGVSRPAGAESRTGGARLQH